MTALRTIPVGLGTRAYDIVAGEGALEACAPRIVDLSRRERAIVVTDSGVAGLHLERLEAALAPLSLHPLIIPPGEASKSFARLEALIDALLALDIERGEPLIAFGGGVIGDLAGFAAAIVKRGVDFVQIPTTLLAQADSSVGGKTGINTPRGKNLVGAFHQPRLVVADSGFLDTLPEGERRAGYAEIAKAALIGDAALFARLESAGAGALRGEALTDALAAAIAFKARIVEADERESGARALLNLGHTFGHALEGEALGAIRHGEAVAAGIALAFAYSVRIGVCPEADAARAAAHLRAVGLPIDPKTLPGGPYEPARLLARMRGDKKNAGGAIALILAKGIGRAYIEPRADEIDLGAFLKQAFR